MDQLASPADAKKIAAEIDSRIRALRELVIHDPEAVRQFLHDYEGVLAAQVKREVRNKLTTGLKNPPARNRRVPQ